MNPLVRIGFFSSVYSNSIAVRFNPIDHKSAINLINNCIGEWVCANLCLEKK